MKRNYSDHLAIVGLFTAVALYLVLVFVALNPADANTEGPTAQAVCGPDGTTVTVTYTAPAGWFGWAVTSLATGETLSGSSGEATPTTPNQYTQTLLVETGETYVAGVGWYDTDTDQTASALFTCTASNTPKVEADRPTNGMNTTSSHQADIVRRETTSTSTKVCEVLLGADGNYYYINLVEGNEFACTISPLN